MMQPKEIFKKYLPHLAGSIFTAFLLASAAAGFFPSRDVTAWQVCRPLEPVVRLHVRAAGDHPADQRFKMGLAAYVRQILAEECPPQTNDNEVYLQFLKAYLPEMERSLQEYAAAAAPHPGAARITARLNREKFPLRTYGRRIYPAGTYTALTVTIGEGAGENWWCLLFPPLCLPLARTTEDPVREKNAVAAAGLKESPRPNKAGETDSTTEGRPETTGRWRSKIWEFFNGRLNK